MGLRASKEFLPHANVGLILHNVPFRTATPPVTDKQDGGKYREDYPRPRRVDTSLRLRHTQRNADRPTLIAVTDVNVKRPLTR